MLQTPADPPDARLCQREEVSHLQQDVREHAGAVHAHPHPQPQPQVQHLRQSLQSPLATSGMSR